MKTKTKHASSGHGYRAVIEDDDGQEIYDSEKAYPGSGEFPDAVEAETHAKATMAAMGRMESERAAYDVELRVKFSDMAAEQLQLLSAGKASRKQFSDAARGHKKVIEEREGHLERLSASSRNASVSLRWQPYEGPGAVSVVRDPSALDDPWEPQTEIVEPGGGADVDDRQMSLSGVNWAIGLEDGELTKASGFGSVRVRVDGGNLTVVLGADEHVIRVTVSGPVTLEGQTIEEVKASAPTPAAAPLKRTASASHKMGKASAKVLRSRLYAEDSDGPAEVVVSGETLLGLYELELRREKPRANVKSLLDDAMEDHAQAAELALAASSMDRGLRPRVEPDIGAGAILSAMDGEILAMSATYLETAIVECMDICVLDFLIEFEDEQGDDARDEVGDAARDRIAELCAEPIEAAV